MQIVDSHVCRLSPFVSGVVYLAYAAFIAYLIPKSRQELHSAADSSFPQSWTHDAAGKAGLCIFGIAFLAGAQACAFACPSLLCSSGYCEACCHLS